MEIIALHKERRFRTQWRTQCVVGWDTSCSGLQVLHLHSEDAGFHTFLSPSRSGHFINKYKVLNSSESNFSHLPSSTSQALQFQLNIHVFILGFRALVLELERPGVEPGSLVVAPACKSTLTSRKLPFLIWTLWMMIITSYIYSLLSF